MSKKRRQRSTAIRKRIEKKQREDEKRKKKAAKAEGGGGDGDVMLRVVVARRAAEQVSEALGDLAGRLSEEPIRGWTPSDMEEQYGLGWLADLLGEGVAESEADPLELQVPEPSKQHLLERLDALEMAAPGLKVDWEAGFGTVLSAVSAAEVIEEEEEEGPAPIPESIAHLFDNKKSD